MTGKLLPGCDGSESANDALGFAVRFKTILAAAAELSTSSLRGCP
jgi:hypothetical protein